MAARTSLMAKKKKETGAMFSDLEPVVDGLGITHFLPPRRLQELR